MENDLSNILSLIDQKSQKPLSLDDAHELGYCVEKFRAEHDMDIATLAETIKAHSSSSDEGAQE
ncbi:MAG: hypothetical protein Q4C41_04360 [Eggerthellaceae bacterium]|nr:hypothetical protein [Eggerthellaceae bacterium]